MHTDGKIYMGLAQGQQVNMELSMSSRHGLIAGASGTGKTITMKVMAEAFSNAGVPVFLCDVKGDVSELAMPGEALLPSTETSSEFLFSEDGSRSVIIGPKGVTWDYDENGVAVFTEDCEQKMAENQGYLWEQGANSYLSIIGQDYDALAATEANKGDRYSEEHDED